MTTLLTLNAMGGLIAAVAWFTRWCHRRGQRPRIPAAPDNVRGRNTEALWTCRRIEAQPTTRKEKRP